MKKSISVLLLGSLLLGLLSGCGNNQPPEKEPTIRESVVEAGETQAGELTYPVFEENTVDDSFSFTWEYSEKAEYPDSDFFSYVNEKLMKTYVDTWVDNGEILDQDFCGIDDNLHTYLYGWILFRGTPKQETGWKTVNYQGEPAYCRTVCIKSTEKDGEFQFLKSQGAIPSHFVRVETVLGQGKMENNMRVYEGEIGVLPEIASAELYNRRLSQVFTLTDPQKLSILQKAVSPGANIDRDGGIPCRGFYQAESWNPLILTLKDGKQLQVYTMEDGSCGCNIWDMDAALEMPMSIFELFGVPMDAAGYEKNAEGQTIVTDAGIFSVYYEGRHMETQEKLQLTFSEMGNLIRRDWWTTIEGEPYEYIYDKMEYGPDHQLIHYDSFYNDKHRKNADYTYNDHGDISLITEHFEPNGKLDTVYTYDEQNRLISIIGYKENGTPQSISAHMYYWYDEEGHQHPYQYNEDGSIFTGIAPDAPVRKTK